MSYQKNIFIGKLEELSLSGLLLELVVVVVGCTVVAAALSGTASSLHSSRRKEWKEADGNCERQRGVVADTASCVLFAAKRRCFVDGSEFGKKGRETTAGGVLFRDRSTAEGVE